MISPIFSSSSWHSVNDVFAAAERFNLERQVVSLWPYRLAVVLWENFGRSGEAFVEPFPSV
jgi:hypothetical protein